MLNNLIGVGSVRAVVDGVRNSVAIFVVVVVADVAERVLVVVGLKVDVSNRVDKFYRLEVDLLPLNPGNDRDETMNALSA
jgi:hypothetical protein